ncbi:MAG: secondary thiamine-phosphate synthase enzyme YjbQ [Candidatus Pacebacteria bacterium]|nr:secondary thiamine-phosphate synthase enzyme YjbQ [Candidatus Paceibacterota bacterium]
MKSFHKILEYQTKSELEFNDITDAVKDFAKNTGIKNGIINVQSLHTTAAVILNENEPLLIEDMKENLKKIAPKESYYKHNDFKIRTVNMCEGECANGHSHCQAIYLTPNVTINLINNEVQLGIWQRILFIELDHPRPRKVQIHILGE